MNSFNIHVASEEINSSNIKEKNTDDYKIINYEKGYVCFDDEETGKYRSVVVCKKTNQVVAYGPKKSISMELFMERYPEFEGHVPADVYVCEIVEGTMINLFFDKERNTWEIATKSAMGGHYWFYRQYYNNSIGTEQYTFRQMFMEAVGESALSDLNESYLVKNLDKNMSYSFVLQHPANHIVLDITIPKVYLVAIFEITHDSVGFTSPLVTYKPRSSVDVTDLRSVKSTDDENTIRHVPLFEYYTNSSVLIDKHQYGVFYLPARCNGIYNRLCYSELQTPNIMCYFHVGYMVVNSNTGDRVTVKSENYERLKNIRGNHPNLQYQYLAIMRTGKITEFIQNFPIYKTLFHQFYEQISDYVKSVHNIYLEVYVKKNKDMLLNVNKHMRYHLQQIHYQKHILNKQIVTRDVVLQWFLYTLEPGQFLYLLRSQVI